MSSAWDEWQRTKDKTGEVCVWGGGGGGAPAHKPPPPPPPPPPAPVHHPPNHPPTQQKQTWDATKKRTYDNWRSAQSSYGSGKSTAQGVSACVGCEFGSGLGGLSKGRCLPPRG